MGRTAPAPNAAAPPGMCPFVAVKAGGGAGGGGSGGGAGSGSGGAGAGAGSGADGADGGTKGADAADGACGGAGSGNGCPNPSHGAGGGATAGDPVDVLTGRVFTIPAIDLRLGGPLPLIVERYYSSHATDRDVGLGPGWSHSLAWEVEVRRRKIVIWRDDGKPASTPSMKAGDHARVDGRVLRRHERGFTLDCGRTQLAFERRSPTSRRYRLTAVHDRHGNRIALTYDSAGLSEITDSVGRRVRVARDRAGKIAAFEVFDAATQRWKSFARYAHDDRGDLVAVTDACGATVTHAYERHLLVSLTTAMGRVTHWAYDAQDRCVETWVDYPMGVDPSIDREAPERLADGVTRARGVLHTKIGYFEDLTEVVTSREVRQVFGNERGKYVLGTYAGGVSTAEYDAAGHMTAHVDPIGATTRWRHDREGRLLEEIDPEGHRRSYKYDARGFLVSERDPSHRTLTYQRNGAGDVLRISDDAGEIVEHSYDARGLWIASRMPDGAVNRMSYDAQGNRVEVVEPSGATKHFEYDGIGRIVAATDERGQVRRFEYDACGRLIATFHPDGGVSRKEYDLDGNLSATVTPGGQRFELSWSGFDVVHQVRRPDGTRLDLRYDREGALVRVVNEENEEHRIVRDLGGRIIAETTFDGRDLLYGLDLAGRLTRVGLPGGAWVSIEYDMAGRITRRSWSDELIETFEYDPRGLLVRAEADGVETTFAYDATGKLVRETQTVEGQTESIQSVFDARGFRSEKSTSRGYDERVAYDPDGRVRSVSLSGRQVDFVRDVAGAEIERRLPGGAVIQSRYDASGRRMRRTLLKAGAGAGAAAGGEPAWLGPAAGVVLDQTFEYEPRGFLATIGETNEGSTTLRYDAVGRLLEKASPGRPTEKFRYDGTGSLFDGRARTYARGGRLIACDGTEHRYDADGRLIERKPPKGRSWRYHYDPRGLLSRVDRPDGSRVELVHDAFARRVVKRLVDRSGQRLRCVRYVWDGDRMVHEIREETGTVVEERTYAYEPLGLGPLAHRVVRHDGGAGEDASQEQPWVHYLLGTGYRPEALANDRGDLLARYHEWAWGRIEPIMGRRTAGQPAADTPLRFAGHMEDEETGLFYNRYRHYDPDTGRYLTPEPLGLMGGLRAYEYALDNPLHFVDLGGLAPMTSRAHDGQGTEGNGVSVSGTTHRSSKTAESRMHPVVQDALLSQEDSMEPAQNGSMRSPAACAEPTAVSNYLDAKGIPRQSFDDMSPTDQARTREALEQMRIGANESNPGNPARAPCMNCSQFLANLHATAGGPSGGNVAPGAIAPNAGGGTGNFSPPSRPQRADGSAMATGIP